MPKNVFGFMKAYNYSIEHYNSSENGKKETIGIQNDF